MKLIHGDCLVEMAQIPDHSIDMILCDLPYGTTYADFDTVLKNGTSYPKTSIIPLDALWCQYKRLISKSGVIVLTASQPFTTQLIYSNMPMFKYSWVWEKNKAANHVAIKFQPLKIHEDILIFSNCGVNTGALNPIPYNPQGVVWKTETKTRKNDIKKEGTFKYNSLKAGDFKVEGTNYPKSVIKFDTPSGCERHIPTQKPVPLLEYLIKSYTNEGETVLDNCMGSGSTGVACVNTNRNFIGIEKDDKYFEIAKNRILKSKAIRTRAKQY